MSNRLDQMSRLIWIDAVCKTPILSPMTVKELSVYMFFGDS